jgi:hypothetical protein
MVFHEIRYDRVPPKSVETLQVRLQYVDKTSTSHEDQCTLMIVSNWILLTRFFLDKRCRQNQHTPFKFSNFSPTVVPFMSYCGKYGTARQTTNENKQCCAEEMGFSCWKTKDRNTHSEYVILLLFHCNNGCTYAPQCYVVIRALSSYWLVTLILPKQSADLLGHDIVQDSYLFTDGLKELPTSVLHPPGGS